MRLRAWFLVAGIPAAGAALFGCPTFGADICIGEQCNVLNDGGGSDGQIVPPGCDLTKDPKDSVACVDESIGIFVSANGSDSNAGTKASPLKSITSALAKVTLQHSRVYVCDGTYGETVKLSGAVGIFGGFSCTDWSYDGNAGKVGPTGSGYALDIENISGVTIEDLEFDAQNGVNPGDSSIAIFVASSTATFKRVKAVAGNGATGADAVATSNYDADAGSINGNSADSSLGAPTKDCACLDGTHSQGGAGGGTLSAGQDGGPAIPPFDGHGMGGVYNLGCGAGKTGNAGAPADAGAVGSTSLGQLTSTGFSRSTSASGANGAVAQGGGGGSGGAVSGMNNEGGGSGGCGGCGGAGGAGGMSGGSSYAILSYQTTLTLDTCIMQVGGGGDGKNGGVGQAGQTGGTYGNQVSAGPGCQGGSGAQGGAGAGGGGGAGGNAIAIGYVGTKPTMIAGSMTEGTAGAAGAGGAGSGGNNGLAGAAGTKADMQELP
jgi:hypothetical protein